MLRALDELRIEGIATTIPFHEKVLQHAEFAEGRIDTSFVERTFLNAEKRA
jgi:acetyl-CoA carboxylase biotin carboxylase subunit